ncbi:MAG TPA: MMPL family transporter, partial [Planctomycetaceae bacterium]|nr:MMPL family transporter [Planctomycetaceae bacterium]
VRDFGVYSSVGCLIGFIAVMYCLPSMLQFWPSKGVPVTNLDSRPWHLLGGWLCRHHLPITVICLGLGIWATAGLQHFKTETKVIRYFPKDSDIVADYHFIEDNLVNIVSVDTIVQFDEQARKDLTFVERIELVRRIEEKIRKHPEISGTLSLADMFEVQEIPEFTPEDSRGGLFRPNKKMAFYRRSNELEKRVFNGERDASAFVSRGLEEGAKLPTGEHISPNHYRLSNPQDELWRISAQVAIMSDLNYGDLTDEIDEIAQSELKIHAGTKHVVTGMVPIFLRTQEAVLESLIRSFAYAFVLIAIVLMIVLKDPISGLLTMLPNLWPVGVVFGLISWNGLDVDIGTMITASVALGIAIDGTLHLLTWFRQGIREGRSREDSIALAMGHCAPAMWQTSMIVGLGMYMLSFADLLLVSRFGWLMAALIGAATFADLILLPAMLAGSLGSFIEKRIPRDDAEQPPEPVVATEMADSREKQPSSAVREPHLQSFSDTDRKLLRKDSGMSPNT